MSELDFIRELNDYSLEEDDLRNNVLALESYRMGGDESLRPSLAEQRKVGFFRLDRPTQTEVTEIVDLQEMTEVLQTLLQDVNILKREIHTARGVMLADFESKLQKKALELYCRINNRVDELEKMHADRVGVIRRAFRQQLSDALSNVASIFDKNYQNKMNSDQKKKNAKADKLEAKIKELQGVIQRNDMVIDMLKTQLAQYSKQAAEEEEESRPPTKSPSINPEMDDLRENVFHLENKVADLEKALDAKTDQAANLSDEVNGLAKKLEQEKRSTRLLQEELENLRENSEQEMAEARKMNGASRSIIEQQRIEMEQEMNDKAKQAREEVLSMARSEAAAMADSEGKKAMKLIEEKKKLEEQLAKERALVAELCKKKPEPVVEKKEEKVVTDVDKIILSEQKWRVMVAKMKKELEKTHKMWEKKFAILQHSLHALKDESFLRQTLQKQAATLHHAAVSYATDTPLAILPTRPPNSPTKKPLPEIPIRSKSPASTLLDDENQVMSDDEQGLPPGIVPLPTPPVRNLTDCGEDSRPSTRSHVVVVPSVEAQ